LTAEEHLAAGGLGEAVAAALLQEAVGAIDFRPIVARGYPSGRYGSQQWHRLENDLAGAGLLATFEDWMARDDSRTHQRAG
jgi:transketolase